MDASMSRAPRLHCISAAPAALDRYPRGVAGHVAHPVRSILAPTLVGHLAILSCVHSFLISFSLSGPELQPWALNVERLLAIYRSWAFACSSLKLAARAPSLLPCPRDRSSDIRTLPH
jgi:hypothetical protein